MDLGGIRISIIVMRTATTAENEQQQQKEMRWKWIFFSPIFSQSPPGSSQFSVSKWMSPPDEEDETWEISTTDREWEWWRYWMAKWKPHKIHKHTTFFFIIILPRCVGGRRKHSGILLNKEWGAANKIQTDKSLIPKSLKGSKRVCHNSSPHFFIFIRFMESQKKRKTSPSIYMSKYIQHNTQLKTKCRLKQYFLSFDDMTGRLSALRSLPGTLAPISAAPSVCELEMKCILWWHFILFFCGIVWHDDGVYCWIL